jgi:hypothetical protein
MRYFIRSVFFASALSSVSALAVTIEDHLPLLRPNLTKLGTGFPEFIKAHPLAKDLSLSERKPGALFTGMLSEDQGDGELVVYGFTDDDLASLTWASKAAGNVSERIKTVREEIVRLHGPPKKIEYAARMDANGAIGKITREVFQSKWDTECVICLMATSFGIEVELTDESVFEKHGRVNIRENYEDAVKAVGKAIPSDPNAFTVVDYLPAARDDAERPKEAEPETPSPKAIDVDPQMPLAGSSKPKRSAGPAAMITGRPSTSLLWWMSGPAVVALVLLAKVVRKRRR